MKKRIFALFAVLALVVTSAFATDFPDTEKHWAKDAINNMNLRGVINGYEDGTFRPNADVTYGEAAKMICLAAGLDPVTDASNDLPGMTEHWSAPYLRALPRIIVFVNPTTNVNTVYPNDAATREDVAVMIAHVYAERDADIKSDSADNFHDADQITPFAKDAVGYMVDHEIITGYTSTTFLPQENVSRAELCTMLLRAFPEAIQF